MVQEVPYTWVSLGMPVSSSNKTCHYNISEILLKLALNTITLSLQYLSSEIALIG